ncbi:MAG TPA: metal-dependent hydrolase [Candidatus Saccharimonadia bacterium]|jgi:inner membrane protein
MTGRTHDTAALTALIAATILYPPVSLSLATALVALLANQIGGITPDIDQPTAPFWRNLPAQGVIGKVFDKLLGGHRFLTHSLLGVALFAWLAHLLLVFLSPIMHHIDITLVWYAFLIGLISHLVMDTFTKEGVPWLLPIPIKFGLPPVKALRVTTGHFVENLIIFPGLILLDVWLISNHYHAIHTFIQTHLGS